jgi:hypothetical protein
MANQPTKNTIMAKTQQVIEAIKNLNLSDSHYIYIFVFFIIMFIIRDIDLFINPRFWAEEGTIYFSDVYKYGISHLFNTHQGYFSIIPNFATYLATFVPLKFAPFVTTFIALIVQIIPLILIFKIKTPYFDTVNKKFIASLIILFSGNTSEIWLNSITSQFHFVVILFLILLDTEYDKYVKTKYALIFISGLSGVPANVLILVTLLNYFKSKNIIFLKYSSILFITIAIQLFYIIILKEQLNTRFDINIFKSLIYQFYYYFVYPFYYQFKLKILIVLQIPLIYIIFKYLKYKEYFMQFFIFSFVMTYILVFGSIGGTGGGRYAYSTGVILLLGLLIASYDLSLTLKIRRIIKIYIFISIFIVIYNFPIRDGEFNSVYWIKWFDEVKTFDPESKNKLLIYPQWQDINWSIKLEK